MMDHLIKYRQPPFLFLTALVLAGLLLGQGGWQAKPALAQTAIAATQDTFVDPNNASTNYDGKRLELAYSNFPTLVGTRRVLLQFDLRNVTGALSTAPVVLTAVENNFPAGATLTLGLYGLADTWTEAAVTDATRPTVGAKLQTVTVAAGSNSAVRFDAAAVGAYLEAQRTGDGVASFLLQLDEGSGTLGFGGNLFFEDSEGSSNGLNGDEPAIDAPTAPTATPTNTTAAPTATPTNTTAAPTATPTNTTAAPTATPTNTTAAPTATPTNTTAAPTATPTNTTEAPTATPTNTTAAPTPTNTTAAPTATPTNTTEAPTATPTNTTAAPTATPTNTTAAPTATSTNTTEAPTATPTNTTEAPTATPTNTTAAPTATPTNTTEAPTATPTNTTEAPTATPTNTTEAPTATPTNTAEAPTATPTNTTEAPTATPTATVSPAGQTVYYLSSASNSKVAGISYQDEDILRYSATDGWSLFFDGSDVKVAKNDVDDFYLMADGSILLSFEKPMKLPGLGLEDDKVDDADIVRFVPSSLGSNTSGSFSLYFDGSDVELTKGNEDIDAFSLDGAGNLILSTSGSVTVEGVKGRDEDLLKFIPTSLGETTAGRWELLLDGSTLDLTSGDEDINALWIDPVQGNRYLATKGNFRASGSQNSLEGDSNDLFGCAPLNDSCFFFAVFDGALVGFTKRIDGVSLDLAGNSFTLPTLTAASDELPDPVDQYEVLPDAPLEDDAEYDAFDQPLDEGDDALLNRLFLPLVNR